MPLLLPLWLLFSKDGGWLFVRPKRSFQWYHKFPWLVAVGIVQKAMKMGTDRDEVSKSLL